MKISSLGVSRPAYYDRNPVFAGGQSSTASSGAGSYSVQSDIYTVPAGKKFYLTQLTVTFLCVTTFTAGDLASLILRVKVGGVTTNNFGRATWYFSKINESNNIQLPAGTVMNTGDVLAGLFTGQASGANTVSTFIYFGGTLFDA